MEIRNIIKWLRVMSLVEEKNEYYLKAKKSLSKNICNLMKKHGLKDVRALAKLAGLEDKTALQIINCVGNPTVRILSNIAHAFSIDIDELFKMEV